MKRPLCMVAILFIIICIICLKLFPVTSDDFASLEGEYIIITGQVAGKEWKNTASGSSFLITLKDVRIEEVEGQEEIEGHEEIEGQKEIEGQEKQESQQPAGKVFCYMPEDTVEPEMGSRVRVAGRLSNFEKATNPGQFSQADYYRILKVDFKLYKANILARSMSSHIYEETLYRLKERLGQALDKCLGETEATIMRTMLLGESGQTDKEIKELYKRNGIIHILAISGLHISMIGMGLYRLLRRIAVPIPLAAPAAIAVMYSYGVMTNMSISSLRAIVMFTMHMTAHLLGRTYDLLTALATAAILILLEQPLYLYHSGFLFSFLAVLAIGLFIPAMNESLSLKIPLIEKHMKAFLAGFCISAVTLPIYAIFYYQFPLYSILLNLIVIPLMSLLMITGILTMAVGCIWIPLGKITAAIATVILVIYEKSCTFCENLPLNNLIIGEAEVWQIITYGGILIFLILFYKKLRPFIHYLILCSGILILLLRMPSGLMITFLDVGQGDCIHIQSPSGRNYLIDGGSSSSQKVGEYRLLPYLKSQGVRRLDGVFITHPDQDHYSAFPELVAAMKSDGIPITSLILPGISAEAKSNEYRMLEKMAEEAGITLQYISQGQELQEGELHLQCLHPAADSQWTDSNAYSTVLLLKYRGFSALFTGDVEGLGEQNLIGQINRKKVISNLTILKVSHHGSRNSTSETFLQQIDPAYAVISAGRENSYGHPHKELLERLEKINTKVYITYKTGAITIRTNGAKMELEQFLPK